MRRGVTVLDVDLPPGVAFLRSLGRAGVPVTAAASCRTAAGRFSRYATAVTDCPPVQQSDALIDWLVDGFEQGTIDLVAPTSDYVSFCLGAALEKIGGHAPDAGHPPADAVRTCLFKARFHRAMMTIGFPTLATASPTTTDEALTAAEAMGYPVVLKPRSHVGLGTVRGLVVQTPDELATHFVPFRVHGSQSAVFQHDPDVMLPLIQRFHDLGTVEVVSMTGCLDRDGAVVALGHCRKVSQSPRRLGVGTMFEPAGPQPFTDAAIEVVRELLGSGLFELEILVDKASGEYWALELNPRGFGQMSLDIALGTDLPVIWYRSVTGEALAPAAGRPSRPRFWHEAPRSYLDVAAGLARGPQRGAVVEHAVRRLFLPTVGAIHEWRDPLPGVRYGLAQLRHPLGLLRPYFGDPDVAGGVGAPQLLQA